MRKLSIIILLSLLSLTSCNLPLVKSTPNTDVVATRVAQTLSAQPSATLQPTQEVLPTIELTTPPPTATLTVTSTPTTSPGDPKLTLGSPNFQDTFNGGNAFGLQGSPYEDDAVRISMQSGAINFTSLAINAGKRWRLTSPQPRNFYLEGTFKTINCSGYDHFGLVMRAPSYSDGIGYYFGVSCNGQYIFQRWDGSGTSTVIGWASDPNIKTGPNQTNRIGVKAVDDTFKLYVNGYLVKEFTDSGLTAKGHFGAYVTALENSNFTVDLEELLEWNLP